MNTDCLPIANHLRLSVFICGKFHPTSPNSSALPYRSNICRRSFA